MLKIQYFNLYAVLCSAVLVHLYQHPAVLPSTWSDYRVELGVKRNTKILWITFILNCYFKSFEYYDYYQVKFLLVYGHEIYMLIILKPLQKFIYISHLPFSDTVLLHCHLLYWFTWLLVFSKNITRPNSLIDYIFCFHFMNFYCWSNRAKIVH